MIAEDRLLLLEYIAEKRLINAPVDFKSRIESCRIMKHNLNLLKVMKEANLKTIDQAIGFYTSMLNDEKEEINKILTKNSIKIIDTDIALTINKKI